VSAVRLPWASSPLTWSHIRALWQLSRLLLGSAEMPAHGTTTTVSRIGTCASAPATLVMWNTYRKRVKIRVVSPWGNASKLVWSASLARRGNRLVLRIVLETDSVTASAMCRNTNTTAGIVQNVRPDVWHRTLVTAAAMLTATRGCATTTKVCYGYTVPLLPPSRSSSVNKSPIC
jgi:hypothetical protein